MSAPFEKLGYKVVYYRLNEDLTVDLAYLGGLLKVYKPQAVLTMNYYGSASTKEAVALVKAFDETIQVIEDFSHCTFCLKKSLTSRWISMYRAYVSRLACAMVL